MNTTRKIGTVAGALWFVGIVAMYIAGAVFTGTSKGREIYALVVAAPRAVDLEDDRRSERHHEVV